MDETGGASRSPCFPPQRTHRLIVGAVFRRSRWPVGPLDAGQLSQSARRARRLLKSQCLLLIHCARSYCHEPAQDSRKHPRSLQDNLQHGRSGAHRRLKPPLSRTTRHKRESLLQLTLNSPADLDPEIQDPSRLPVDESFRGRRVREPWRSPLDDAAFTLLGRFQNKSPLCRDQCIVAAPPPRRGFSGPSDGWDTPSGTCFSMGRCIVLHCIAVIVADDAFTESPGRVRYEANGVVLEG
ncbi:hypothetical protein EDB80DRAFT_722700 [Ilyonectria destructans]|nr:hypothetical protein EDB80DRAFT_722700 [Ilyonectria destructans]